MFQSHQLAAIIFTDIVGNTVLIQETCRKSWYYLLATAGYHGQLLRNTIKAANGMITIEKNSPSCK